MSPYWGLKKLLVFFNLGTNSVFQSNAQRRLVIEHNCGFGEMKNYAIDLFFVLKKGIAAKIVLLRCVFLSIEEYWVIIEEFYKRNW